MAGKYFTISFKSFLFVNVVLHKFFYQSPCFKTGKTVSGQRTFRGITCLIFNLIFPGGKFPQKSCQGKRIEVRVPLFCIKRVCLWKNFGSRIHSEINIYLYFFRDLVRVPSTYMIKRNFATGIKVLVFLTEFPWLNRVAKFKLVKRRKFNRKFIIYIILVAQTDLGPILESN